MRESGIENFKKTIRRKRDKDDFFKSTQKKRVRRNSDDEPIDVDYHDLTSKWDSIYDSLDPNSPKFDPMGEKFMRKDLYNDQISEARRKLRQHNRK